MNARFHFHRRDAARAGRLCVLTRRCAAARRGPGHARGVVAGRHESLEWYPPVARDRPRAHRADDVGGRLGAASGGVLRRHDGRRGLEDHRRRQDVEPDDRRLLRRHDRRGRSSSRAIPTSSGPAAARRRSAATSPTVTASGSRWMPARRGATWGSRETQYISRIVTHPTDPNIVYVGALGHVFGPNAERGVYRTQGRRQDLDRRSSSRTTRPAWPIW